MAKGIPEYFQIQNYQITPGDIIQLTLGVEPDEIHKRVLMNPCWNPDVFESHINQLRKRSEKVYEFEYQGELITYIISGIGAPLTGDIVLSLGVTVCDRLIFIGSAGGLIPNMIVGDLVLPTESIAGDGFSCYLNKEKLNSNSFGKAINPDSNLFNLTERAALKNCLEQNSILHKGPVYSIDTIVGQFHHLETITSEYKCIAIEMETAAVFKAAKLCGINAAALLQLSDVIPVNKSIFSGRSSEDNERRYKLKRTLLAKTALEVLRNDT